MKGVRNDCNRKCNGLSSVKWQKTFISLRNPCGYIGHLCLIKAYVAYIVTYAFYAFLCISSSGGMLFVYFPCYYIKLWKVEKCDEIVWVTKCKCDGSG